MKLIDIINVFEQLGIKCVIINDKAKFYDMESGLQMERREDKTKELSLDKLQMDTQYTLRTPNKMFRFVLTNPRINGEKDKTQVILKQTCYNDEEGFHVVNLGPIGNHKSFEVRTDYIVGNVIHVEDNNYIYFEINNKFGEYQNGYKEGYYLSVDEMKEALNSSKEIRIFSEYYGKLYPELMETIQNATSFTK